MYGDRESQNIITDNVEDIANVFRDLCKTHCSKFAHFIIFLYLYSMKQRPSSPSFADLIVGHRKVKRSP